MKIFIVALVALLTGCSALRPEIIEVKVAVPVPCQLTEPERPSMPTESLSPDAPVDVQSRYLRAEIDIRTGYEDKLLTTLRGCLRPPPAAV